MPEASFFQVGGRYRNNQVPHEVLEISESTMRIRYDDGQSQLIRNLQLQERIVETVRRQRAERMRCYEILAEAQATNSGPYTVYVILH